MSRSERLRPLLEGSFLAGASIGLFVYGIPILAVVLALLAFLNLGLFTCETLLRRAEARQTSQRGKRGVTNVVVEVAFFCVAAVYILVGAYMLFGHGVWAVMIAVTGLLLLAFGAAAWTNRRRRDR